jgi:hypothetical protein
MFLKFTEDLNKIDFDKLTDQDDVNKMFSDFEEAFRLFLNFCN